MFKEHELLYELEDTGAIVIVAQDQLMPLVRTVLPRTALQTVFVTSLAEMLPAEPTMPVPETARMEKVDCPDAIDLLLALRAATEAPPSVSVDLDDPAALNYTGGTTGMPKGCVHTQRDMIYTAATTCTCANQTSAADVILNFHPMFWIAGENSGVIFPIFTGATLILLARWDPAGLDGCGGDVSRDRRRAAGGQRGRDHGADGPGRARFQQPARDAGIVVRQEAE